MDIETLNTILNEKSMSFTLKEITEMLDEELKVPINEMDTEIIEACLDALESAGVI